MGQIAHDIEANKLNCPINLPHQFAPSDLHLPHQFSTGPGLQGLEARALCPATPANLAQRSCPAIENDLLSIEISSIRTMISQDRPLARFGPRQPAQPSPAASTPAQSQPSPVQPSPAQSGSIELSRLYLPNPNGNQHIAGKRSLPLPEQQ